MTGPEIKHEIERINELNRSLITPDIWTLNIDVAKNLVEIAKLRAQCPHEFENGQCKWCYLKEEKND